MRFKCIGKKSQRAREIFGSEISRMRTESGLSVSQIAYALDVSSGTVFEWMRGTSFPGSIFTLKKLQFLFSDTHETIQYILQKKEVAVSDEEWDDFLNQLKYDDIVYCSDLSNRNPWWEKHNHICDDIYREAFGEYLRESRIKESITIKSLSHALGVKYGCYYRWERGISFPRDIMVLGYLDRFYGNVFDVVFGICPKYGLDLDEVEKKKIARRMYEYKKGDKSGWSEHHKNRLRAQRRWNNKKRN